MCECGISRGGDAQTSGGTYGEAPAMGPKLLRLRTRARHRECLRIWVARTCKGRHGGQHKEGNFNYRAYRRGPSLGGKSGNTSCLAPRAPCFQCWGGAKAGPRAQAARRGRTAGRSQAIRSTLNAGGWGGRGVGESKGTREMAGENATRVSRFFLPSMDRNQASSPLRPRSSAPRSPRRLLRDPGRGGWGAEAGGDGGQQRGGGRGRIWGRHGGHSRRGGATWGLPPLPCMRYVLGTGRPPPR